MLTYTVKSLPLKDVISDLAKEFHTTYKEECDLYILKLPPYVGKGSIKGINFKNGLGLIIYDCTFNEDVRLEFTLSQVHPMKYLYCLEGELVHKFANEPDQEHQILKYLNIIVASTEHHGHILEFKKQVPTCINSLEINRNDFQPELDCDTSKLDTSLKNTLLDTDASSKFLYSGDYSLKTAKVFEEIKNFPYEDFLRKGFLHSKAWEILIYQTIHYTNSLASKVDSGQELKNLDIVREVAQKIDTDFLAYDNIEDLASEVNLSSKYLQHIFKKHHNITINQYIMNRRMEMIVDLLDNTNYPIKEIGELTGIKSISHLSKIFRNQYGMTPSEYRKN